MAPLTFALRRTLLTTRLTFALRVAFALRLALAFGLAPRIPRVVFGGSPLTSSISARLGVFGRSIALGMLGRPFMFARFATRFGMFRRSTRLLLVLPRFALAAFAALSAFAPAFMFRVNRVGHSFSRFPLASSD